MPSRALPGDLGLLRRLLPDIENKLVLGPTDAHCAMQWTAPHLWPLQLRRLQALQPLVRKTASASCISPSQMLMTADPLPCYVIGGHTTSGLPSNLLLKKGILCASDSLVHICYQMRAAKLKRSLPRTECACL